MDLIEPWASYCIGVTDPSAVGEARRKAVTFARQAQLDSEREQRVALVVTEAATNLQRHAMGGDILLRLLTPPAGHGVEILAIDRGPGMVDVARCLKDGYSTGGSAGTGLGAITRLADDWDIYSRVPGGTVLYAVFTAAPRQSRAWSVGAICRTAAGETVPGDTWLFQETAEGARLMVADGLGHGVGAATAARLARQTVDGEPLHSAPPDILRRTHVTLRGSRGVAMAVAALPPAEGMLRYAAVGNIAGAVVDERAQHLSSAHGIVGHTLRRTPEFSYPWRRGALLILHSDGLTNRWQLDAYPGLRRHAPAVIAGVLYRDCQRGHDDATVVVIKQQPAMASRST